MNAHKVLVVVDDPTNEWQLLQLLTDRGYHVVRWPSSGALSASLASEAFRFTVIELKPDASDSARLISRLRLEGAHTGPIMALADSRRSNGAPSGVPGIDWVVSKTDMVRELEQVLHTIGDEPRPDLARHADGAWAEMPRELALWQSPLMREVRQIIEEAAGVDVTVLITGETGTGKDVAARAIHALSSRRSHPFVKVNCAAVPRELLESELFGHERGAFTGAHALRIGKFEAAHMGTMFLDEIGDLHLDLQAKLLHVLQDGDFSRVGGNSTLKVDVRVLAATNQDLERAIAERRFREDLYYRLNVVHIFVPPLRERMEEIPGLVRHFVQMYSKLFHRENLVVSPAIMERLLHHRFPGNVRELENLIKRMILLGDPFLARGLPGASNGDTPRAPQPPAGLGVSLKDVSRRASLAAEREVIASVLRETGGSRVRAAKALHISYRALLYKMKRIGLRDEVRQRPATRTDDDQTKGLSL